MENASRALLMAGSVLIAIIIITLLVKTYSSMGAFQRQQESEQEIARIEEFNKQYTKYYGQYVYGTEVITVINQITNENTKNYKIEAVIEFEEDPDGDGIAYTYEKIVKKFGKETKEIVEIASGEALSITNASDDKVIYAAATDATIIGLKSRAFKCTEIKYGSDGRVDYIKFVEKQYNNLT